MGVFYFQCFPVTGAVIGVVIRVVGFALMCSTAGAGETFDGPVQAVVERVVDGDTLSVRAHIWLGHDVRVVVRLSGVDAPELRGKCEAERAQATAAADYLRRFEGAQVVLSGISYGKFAGRVLADVRHLEEGDLGAALLKAGLVRVYEGGRRLGWCESVTARAVSSADERPSGY